MSKEKEIEEFNFQKNYVKDVSKFVVKKQDKFSYISWADCEKMGHDLDPNFDWTLRTNEQGGINIEGFVWIEMTLCGRTRTHAYPITDNQNNGVRRNPDANNEWYFYKPKTKFAEGSFQEPVTSFELNNSQMRGFAKLFSMMSGLGLSIYTGEDLSQYDKETGKEMTPEEKALKAKPTKAQMAEVGNILNELIADGVVESMDVAKEQFKVVENMATVGQLNKLIEHLKTLKK